MSIEGRTLADAHVQPWLRLELLIRAQLHFGLRVLLVANELVTEFHLRKSSIHLQHIMGSQDLPLQNLDDTDA